MFGFCNQILNMMILTIATTVLLPLEAVGNESLRWLNVGRSCSVGPSSSSFLEIHLNMFAKTLRPSFFLSRHFESNHSRFCEIPPSTSRILMPKTSPNIFDWGRPKHFAYHSGAFRHTKVGLDIVIEVHWKQSQIKGIQSEDIRFGDLESVFFHQELLGMQPNECCEKSHSSRENTVFFSLGILIAEWRMFGIFCPRKNGIRFVLSTCFISYHIKQVLVTSAISGRIKEVEIKFWWCGHGRTSW